MFDVWSVVDGRFILEASISIEIFVIVDLRSTHIYVQVDSLRAAKKILIAVIASRTKIHTKKGILLCSLFVFYSHTVFRLPSTYIWHNQAIYEDIPWKIGETD